MIHHLQVTRRVTGKTGYLPDGEGGQKKILQTPHISKQGIRKQIYFYPKYPPQQEDDIPVNIEESVSESSFIMQPTNCLEAKIGGNHNKQNMKMYLLYKRLLLLMGRLNVNAQVVWKKQQPASGIIRSHYLK